MPWQETKGVGNLDGFFLVAYGKKSWRKSVLRVADARNEIPMKYNLKTKS